MPVIIAFRRRVGGSGMAPMARYPENNNETFKQGAALVMASGYVGECANFNNNNQFLLGFATEYGKNRATDGTAETLHFGSVVNQANAQLIPVGAPMDDGNVGVLLPESGVRFMGALPAANNVAAADLGNLYGLTKDANGYWYINPAITTQDTGACLRITDLIDPIGTAGGKLEFEVISARIQIEAVTT